MDTAREYSKFEWFFYIFFIPLLFTAVLSIVILQFLGFPLRSKIESFAAHTPVLKHWVSTESAASAQVKTDQTYQHQIAGLNTKLKQVTQDRNALNAALTDKNSQIKALTNQIEQLKNQLNQQQANNTDKTSEVKDLSLMDPAKAASILSTLSEDDARQLLKLMKNDIAAAILEKMDPAKAVQLLKSGS